MHLSEGSLERLDNIGTQLDLMVMNVSNRAGCAANWPTIDEVADDLGEMAFRESVFAEAPCPHVTCRGPEAIGFSEL
jgi:hypothetical protein